MDLQHNINIGKNLERLAEYYNNLGFPILSTTCREAANAIAELAKALAEAGKKIEAVENIPVEERKDEAV